MNKSSSININHKYNAMQMTALLLALLTLLSSCAVSRTYEIKEFINIHTQEKIPLDESSYTMYKMKPERENFLSTGPKYHNGKLYFFQYENIDMMQNPKYCILTEYDIASGTTTILTEERYFAQLSLTAVGNSIFWQEGSDSSIVRYNIESGEISVLYTPSTYLQTAFVLYHSGGYLLWHQTGDDGESYEVYAYKPDGEIQQIAVTDYYVSSPYMSQSVYQDVFYYPAFNGDGHSMQTTPISGKDSFSLTPTVPVAEICVSDHFIAWATGYSNHSAYLYKRENKTAYKVYGSSAKTIIHGFTIRDEYMLWVDASDRNVILFDADTMTFYSLHVDSEEITGTWAHTAEDGTLFLSGHAGLCIIIHPDGQ